MIKMKPDIELLKQAQELDAEIYRYQQVLEEVPARMHSLDQELMMERRHHDTLQQELKLIQLKQKQKEGDLNEKENSIKKFESQLTQVKTNKEYASLQSEITSMRGDLSLLEDEIIRLFDQVENCQARLKEEETRLSRVEQSVQAQKKELETKTNESKRQIEELRAKRNDILKNIEPQIAALYEKIIERKKGLALAQVDGEECSACQVRLRAQQINEIQIGESVVLCEQCSRILYIN